MLSLFIPKILFMLSEPLIFKSKDAHDYFPYQGEQTLLFFACNCVHVRHEIALVRDSSHRIHSSPVTSLSVWPSCDNMRKKLLELVLQESNKRLHRKFVVLWLPQLVG